MQSVNVTDDENSDNWMFLPLALYESTSKFSILLGFYVAFAAYFIHSFFFCFFVMKRPSLSFTCRWRLHIEESTVTFVKTLDIWACDKT